jgi:hypothetical protein
LDEINLDVKKGPDWRETFKICIKSLIINFSCQLKCLVAVLDPKWVVGSILENISRKEGLTKGRRLAYLNAFVKFLQQNNLIIGDSSSRNLGGFSLEEILLW